MLQHYESDFYSEIIQIHGSSESPFIPEFAVASQLQNLGLFHNYFHNFILCFTT